MPDEPAKKVFQMFSIDTYLLMPLAILLTVGALKSVARFQTTILLPGSHCAGSGSRPCLEASQCASLPMEGLTLMYTLPAGHIVEPCSCINT